MNMSLRKTGALSCPTSIGESKPPSASKSNKMTRMAEVSLSFRTHNFVTVVENKLNDHDDMIRKLQNEIKMLKMRPKNDNPTSVNTVAPGNDGMGAD